MPAMLVVRSRGCKTNTFSVDLVRGEFYNRARNTQLFPHDPVGQGLA